MATTTTPSKTTGATAVSWTNGELASLGQYASAAIDVSTKLVISFMIQIGRLTGTAFTAGNPQVRIEASGAATGNDTWVPIAIYTPAVGASIAATTNSGTITANDATFTVTSATNIAAQDYLFLGDLTDPTKYELIRVKSIASTTVTPENNVVKGHTILSLVTDQAEAYYPQFDCSAYTRMRVFVDNQSGQGIKVQVFYTTLDSYGTA